MKNYKEHSNRKRHSGLSTLLSDKNGHSGPGIPHVNRSRHFNPGTSLCFLLIFCLLVLQPVTARADSMPTQSVTISVSGLEDLGKCYMCLLVESVNEGGSVNLKCSYADVFAAYAENDDYIFAGHSQQITDGQDFYWSYCPSKKFKILIYLPESDSLLVYDSPLELFSYESHYNIEISDITIHEGGVSEAEWKVKKDNLPGWQACLSFLGRVAVTLITELLLALIFYHKKKQLKVVLYTNLFTQILLNLAVNFIYFKGGDTATILVYFLLEFLIFIIEGSVYGSTKVMYEGEREYFTDYHVLKAYFYSLIANFASFWAGFYLFWTLPR